MAADVTVADATHFSLTGGVATTVRLTGAHKYVDIIPQLGVEWPKIFFAVADREEDLPSVTVDGDDLNVASYPHRVRVRATRDMWIRLISEFNVDLSITKHNRSFRPNRFRGIITPVYFTLNSNTLGVLDQNRLG